MPCCRQTVRTPIDHALLKHFMTHSSYIVYLVSSVCPHVVAVNYQFILLLWAAFYITGRTTKQVVHDFKAETLPRCLKSSPRPFQIVSRLNLLIKKGTMPMIQASLHKTIPPFFIEVVTFDTDDKVV